jgi:hypothetical protein
MALFRISTVWVLGMFLVSYHLGFTGRRGKAAPELASCYPAGARIDDGTHNSKS